ncbi:MAG: serine/threonine protein kinase [Xanthomonadales bacterium]|nr:serine/threonine protein kinase [Xanthomonadales bacterium]
MDDAQQHTERMQRALGIVCAALDRPEDEREQWAITQCAADAALADEVKSLLVADRATLWTERAAGDALADPLLGQLVDRYLIRARLGAGGMGTVYRAEAQGDLALPAVALKVIKRGMDSEEIVARFLRERDILARLEHPHIARLLDGGMSRDGRPWFAMELVDGEPLLEYCDRHALGIDARIGLLLQVCDAVEYAHRSLVVHRDLKPGNVLVDHQGQVKLLDFGIAKLLGSDGDHATRSAAAAMMTPDYAAPEQFDRGVITTQTDVYQLGVLLTELLGGRKPTRIQVEPHAPRPRLDAPFRAAGAARDPTLQQIAACRGLQVPALARRLVGDLDRISRRAIAAAPEQRYASVGALAEDLRRHLRGEPVMAMDDRFSYRLGKFLRRHRLAVGAGAAILLSLALGLTAALRENARSRQAEAQTETTLALLEDVFLGANPYAARAGDTRASDLLDGARERLNRSTDLAPALATRLWAKIASSYVSLENRAAAEAALQQVLAHGERALACRGAACVGPAAEATRATMAAARARLAHYAAAHDHDASARVDLERAIGEMNLLGAGADVELAEALQLLNDLDFGQGDYAQIDARSQQAVELLQRARGANHADTIMAIGNRASLLRASGQAEAALAPAREANDRLTALGTDAPAAVALYVEQQLAGALSDAGQPAAAEPLLRRALTRAQELRGDDSGLASGLAWELAGAHSELGRFPEAVVEYRDLLQRMPDPRSANVAAIHNSLGSALLAEGDADAAADSFLLARGILCAADARIPPCLVLSLNHCDAELSRSARPACLAALEADAQAAGGAIARRHSMLLARAALRAADPTRAEALLAQAQSQDPDTTRDPILRGQVLRLQAEIASARGQPGQALRLNQEAVLAFRERWTAEPAALRAALAGSGER